jgi:hypothetical protein
MPHLATAWPVSGQNDSDPDIGNRLSCQEESRHIWLFCHNAFFCFSVPCSPLRGRICSSLRYSDGHNKDKEHVTIRMYCQHNYAARHIRGRKKTYTDLMIQLSAIKLKKHQT